MDKNRFRVGNIFVSITNPDDAYSRIVSKAQAGEGCMVGVSCFGNILFGYKYEGYADIMNGTLMNLPDGMSLVWFSKLWGIKNCNQANGPTLFVRMLNTPETGIKHFLIGDTDDTLKCIEDKYPNALIVGTVSPPFCDVDDFDYNLYADLIKKSGANIVWISMTSPKQDFFAKKIEPLLPNVILIGVGAAFRYSLGRYKETKGVVKKMGITGLVWRKWSPKLFYVYIKAFVNMLKIAVSIFYKRMIGIRYYQ